MKRILILCAFIISTIVCAAQNSLINWTYEVQRIDSKNVRVIFTGRMDFGYHSYSITPSNSQTDIISVKTKDCSLKGALREEGKFVEENGKLCCYNEMKLIQDISVSGKHPSYSGTIACFVCAGQLCKPENWSFAIKLQ